jgi:hypothetical protein
MFCKYFEFERCYISISWSFTDLFCKFIIESVESHVGFMRSHIFNGRFVISCIEIDKRYVKKWARDECVISLWVI